MKNLLGFYLLRLDAKDPYRSNFICKWKNKLDIGDTNIFKIHHKGTDYKELCISYKTIYINTYNVMVIDITKNTNTMMFRHESF
jgi:hypothetical protein